MWKDLKEKISENIENNTDMAWNLILLGFKQWMKDIEDKNN